MNEAVPGRCACGAVRVLLREPTLFVGHCHCADCRSVHAAAFVTWTAVLEAQLEVRGETSCFASSPGVRREFCPACGTHIRYVAASSPDRVYVPLAILERPLEREPELHVNVASAVPWCVLGDSLPRYEGFD